MDKREFCGSFSVKVDTKRVAFELSPAPLYDGPEDFFRVRVARRWVDTADGKSRFFDRAGLAALVVDAALGVLPEPTPAPDIPCPSRVTVRLWRNDLPYYVGTWTNTLPILNHAGRWMVNVSLGRKRVFVPVEDIITHEVRRHG